MAGLSAAAGTAAAGRDAQFQSPRLPPKEGETPLDSQAYFVEDARRRVLKAVEAFQRRGVRVGRTPCRAGRGDLHSDVLEREPARILPFGPLPSLAVGEPRATKRGPLRL